MSIFSLGLYELFISKIDEAESSDHSKVLAINSLDDLKARLGRMVLLILIVNFFEHAISMDFHGPIDLLAGRGLGNIALALYFTHSDASLMRARCAGLSSKRHQTAIKW